MFDSRLPQDINFDFAVFSRWKLWRRAAGGRQQNISAAPLHINGISSYVLKTWWVHCRRAACKINYWHCPLRNPILKVFQFLNVLLYKKYVSSVTLESIFFFFLFLSTCWNTLAWMHVVWIGIWDHRKLWMEVIIIEIHLGVLTSTLYPRLGSDQRPFSVCNNLAKRLGPGFVAIGVLFVAGNGFKRDLSPVQLGQWG